MSEPLFSINSVDRVGGNHRGIGDDEIVASILRICAAAAAAAEVVEEEEAEEEEVCGGGGGGGSVHVGQQRLVIKKLAGVW